MSRKFKSLLIYPKFQLRLIVSNFFISTISLGIILVGFKYSFSKFYDLLEQAHIPKTHAIYTFVGYQETMIHSFIVGSLIIGLALLIIYNLVLSHKVSGPIMRMKSFFQELQNSEKVAELSFRENDYFEELPEKINKSLRSKNLLK